MNRKTAQTIDAVGFLAVDCPYFNLKIAQNDYLSMIFKHFMQKNNYSVAKFREFYRIVKKISRIDFFIVSNL